MPSERIATGSATEAPLTLERKASAATGTRLRGRPPYGYRLIVAMADGRTAQLLVPDERTAPVVRRIFREYLEGKGLQGIAKGLTSDRVPSPGVHNRCESDEAAGWSKNAVRGILVNPRYAESGTCDPGPTRSMVTRPIIQAEAFERVRGMFAARRTGTVEATPAAGRHYVLRGLVRCDRCARLMQGTWNNGQPYYRCRVPAFADSVDHPRNVYLREQSVMDPLRHWLRTVCAPSRLVPSLIEAGCEDSLEQTLGTVAVGLRTLAVTGVEHAGRQAEVLREFGLRLAYSDADRTAQVRMGLGTAGLRLRGVLHI